MRRGGGKLGLVMNTLSIVVVVCVTIPVISPGGGGRRRWYSSVTNLMREFVTASEDDHTASRIAGIYVKKSVVAAGR